MKPVVLIACDEEFLAARALERVRARLEGEGYGTQEIPPEDLLGLMYALETPSLLDAGRLIVVRDADRLGADALKRIAAWAASGPQKVRLALLAARGAKIAKALGETAEVLEIRAPPPWETAGWLVTWLKGLGRKITPEAAQALVEAVGNDLRDLASAADVLCASSEGVIDPPAVARMFRGAESQVWSFVDAALGGDRAAALRHLRALLAHGENPIGIHVALTRQLRTVALVRGGDRKPAAVLAKELGVKEGAVKRAFRQARALDDAAIRRAFRVMADADRALKGGEQGEGAPPDLVLELLVADLTEEPAERR